MKNATFALDFLPFWSALFSSGGGSGSDWLLMLGSALQGASQGYAAVAVKTAAEAATARAEIAMKAAVKTAVKEVEAKSAQHVQKLQGELDDSERVKGRGWLFGIVGIVGGFSSPYWFPLLVHLFDSHSPF